MKKHLFIIAVLVVAFLGGNLYSAEKGKKVVDKTFKPARIVSLKVVSGNCVIRKGGDSEIKVHVEYSYPAEKFKPVFVEEGDKLELKEDFANSSGNFEGEANWTVIAPAKTNIEMTAASGDLVIEGISGSLGARIASGDIKASQLSGAISINTASGNIHFQGCSGAFKIKCASGDIIMDGIDITGESSFDAVSGDLSVSLAKTPAVNIDISTVSGDTVLKYNGNPIKGSFHFKGMDGNVTADVPFRNREGGKYSPFVEKYYENGPTPKISMKTVSGNLELKK